MIELVIGGIRNIIDIIIRHNLFSAKITTVVGLLSLLPGYPKYNTRNTSENRKNVRLIQKSDVTTFALLVIRFVIISKFYKMF